MRHRTQDKLIACNVKCQETNLGSQVESQRIVTNEATLPLTIPAFFKSSTKDLNRLSAEDEEWYTTRVILTQCE